MAVLSLDPRPLEPLHEAQPCPHGATAPRCDDARCVVEGLGGANDQKAGVEVVVYVGPTLVEGNRRRASGDPPVARSLSCCCQ